MNHRVFMWGAVAAAALMCMAQGPAAGQSSLGPRAGKDALVLELYEKSGLRKQLEQLPLTAQAAFELSIMRDDQMGKLPKNVPSVMRTLAREAFAVEGLKETFLKEMKEKLTAGDMEEVLTWYNSPLGEKCTAMEEAASTPTALIKMRQYAAYMQQSPPAADRLTVIARLDSAVKATESSVEMAINSQTAITLAFMSTLPQDHRKPFDEVVREMDRTRSQVAATVRSETQLALLYTYKDLTDGEIGRYVGFAESPAGSKLQSVCTAAFKKVFLGAGVKWGRAIGEAVKKANTGSDA
jgi:hypothetical protein